MYNSPVSQSNVNPTDPVLALPSCIKVIKEEVGLPTSPSQQYYHGIYFYLSAKTLGQIQQAITNGQRLSVESTLLSDLRYYSLFGQNSSFPSGLTFCSFYQTPDSNQALVRSFIALDGDSIHQICHDCLANPQFALQINLAHHWLINQLISQLRLDFDKWLNTLSWSISIPTVMVTVIGYWERFTEDFWLVVFPPVMAWLLQDGIKRFLMFIFPFLRRWCVGWLLSSSWFRNPITQKIALRILRRLGI